MHLRCRLSPHRRLCPLPLFALRERVGAFEVAAERVLFLHLVDPDLRKAVGQNRNLDYARKTRTIQFSVVKASSVRPKQDMSVVG